MIDFSNGSFLFAHKGVVVYLNIAEAKVDEDTKSNAVVDINLDQDKIRLLDLKKNYKIISVEPVNGSNSSLVLEDIRTNQIHFVRVEPSQAKNRLKFVQLGILVNSSSLSASPLIKYQYIIKTDGKTGKCYHIGIIAR